MASGGSGSGMVGQLPVRSARGAGVKAASSAQRGLERSEGALTPGEHVRMVCWPTMPSVITARRFGAA